jgi:hypothetical protein
MEVTLKEEKQITTWREAVTHVSDLAQARLPESLHGNVQRATALVLNRHVWMDEDGRHGQVLSSDGATWYVCNGHCTCMGVQHATQGLCKHRLSLAIYRRASELLTASIACVQPTAAAQTRLPEAPASANTHLLIEGHAVQVTLRDTDEERLLTRLAALLARYPAAACTGKSAQTSAPAQTTETPTTGEPPKCLYHGPMKASTKAPGTFFCTKKLADGSYCPSRHPER